MSTTTPPLESQGTSTRPYLLRALHDWCTDNGFTPYLAVHVDETVQVPMEYVKNHEIVLNVGFDATSGLKLGNEFIEFKARFGGTARDILVPVDHVVAIYARENGQGMAFPAPAPTEGTAAGTKPKALSSVAPMAKGLRLAHADESESTDDEQASPAALAPDDQPPTPPGGARPSLKRIK